MSNQARKHRGYKSQDILAGYLVSTGLFPYALSAGAGRTGSDVTGTPGIDWEVKARTGFNPTAALKQLKDRDEGKLGIAVLRLNGQGEKNVKDWACVMRLEDVINLLIKAGYGQ